MKIVKILAVTLIVINAVGIVSCSNKEQKKQIQDTIQPLMYLSKEDTTTVWNLTTEFLENLKSEKIDEALDMLYYMDSGKKVVKLPEAMKERQKKVFQIFPVLSYNIDSIIFYSEKDSQVQYTIEFFKKAPGDNSPNTTSFFIKPMRVNGTWYLTMADSNSDNSGGSQIKN